MKVNGGERWGAWLSVWSQVQSRLVLPFWYRPTRVVPKKGPLNVCVCVCGYSKFHYTGPTGPARTLSETHMDPTEFRHKKVRAGPCRARVVELISSSPTMCVDFFWSGPVRSGPCNGI